MTLADRLVVMNKGVAEQIGPPLELYHRPATAFVAGFLGAPAMNLLPIDWDGRFARIGPRLALALPGLDAAPGPLTLGIRPEHLRVGPSAHADAAATVELVEPLGADTLIHIRLDGGLGVVARADGAVNFAAPAPAALDWPADQVHLFDTQGRRIPWKPAEMESRSCLPVA